MVVTFVVVGCTSGEQRGQVNLVALCVANLGVLKHDDDGAGLLVAGKDSTFQNKVHLAMQAKGFDA